MSVSTADGYLQVFLAEMLVYLALSTREGFATASAMTTIGALIKQRRTHLRLSQEDLAKRVGVSRAAIGHWETGDTAPNRRHAPALARALGLDLGQINPLESKSLAFIDIHRSESHIPVLEWEGLLRGEENITQYIAVGVPTPDDAVALIVPDNAMAPDFTAGDVIVISKSTPPTHAKPVVARFGKALLLRKFMRRGPDKDGVLVFDLLSTAPDWPTITCNAQTDHDILGTVVAHIRSII